MMTSLIGVWCLGSMSAQRNVRMRRFSTLFAKYFAGEMIKQNTTTDALCRVWWFSGVQMS